MDAINRNFFTTAPQPASAAKAAAAVPPLDEAVPAAGAAPKQDTVTLSTDERKRALEDALRRKMQEKDDQLKTMREEFERAKKQTESMREATEKQNKCFLIAMRILAGDKVPGADYRYLAQNSPGLYAQAVMLRMSRENPRHYKRLSEDEKQSAQAAQRAGDGKGPGDGGVDEAPALPSPAPDAGGGAETGGAGAGESGGSGSSGSNSAATNGG